MMKTPLLAQLYVLRAQLEVLIVMAEDVAIEPPPPDSQCPHPAERQRNASTFGEPNMVLCLDCGAKHPGTAP